MLYLSTLITNPHSTVFEYLMLGNFCGKNLTNLTNYVVQFNISPNLLIKRLSLKLCIIIIVKIKLVGT